MILLVWARSSSPPPGGAAAAPGRRTSLALARLPPTSPPFIHVFVPPEGDEAVALPKLVPPRHDDGRELRALGDLPLPALHHARQRARREAVAAHLED